jgi:hypothetical protein
MNGEGLFGMSDHEDKPFRVGGRRAPRKTQRSQTAAPPRSGQPGEGTEQRSLDLVQRMVISALIIVVFGLFAAVLAIYLAIYPVGLGSQGDRIGLWIMSGVVGLVAAAAVLITNRRRPYSPWVFVGLLPMAASAYWIFTR